MAAAQAAENHGDEWDLTWYFLRGIYTSIWKTWHPIVNLMKSQWKAAQKAKSVPEIHCYVFNITLPWIKIWRWWCSRCLHNHGFLLYEKFQCVKFRHAEVIHKKIFFCFFFKFFFFFFFFFWNAQLCLTFMNMALSKTKNWIKLFLKKDHLLQ